MEILKVFKDYLVEVSIKGSLGLSLTEILLILFSFLIAVIIRSFFAKIVVFKIKKIVNKTGNTIDDRLFDSLAPPLKILPIIFVFILVGLFIDTENQLNIMINKINRTLTTIFVFWLLHQSLVPLSHVFKKLEELLSKALVDWLTRSFKYLIIFLGIVAILETWGIKIGPVIAGLGLFGVAVALGAQDLFKNLISGILIILEKRFQLGDIIEVPGHATGTVEYIGFRSTLIRQFDTTSISLPNYVFSDTAILNYSDRRYRRIRWTIGLTYESSTEQLKNVCLQIENHIMNSADFVVNEKYQLFVRIDKFNDSSIDILIYTFTNTNEWDKFLLIKQDLAYIIKSIVEKNDCSFAFPSQSIYIEKK
jgi:MscS family membrane protein